MNLTEFTKARKTLAGRLIALLVELFRGFQSWDDADADEFTDQAVPLALGARRTMADLTSLWIADQASAHAGIVVPPTSVPDAVLARPGVTDRHVYTRPFVTVRTKLKQGRPVEDAVRVGANRVEQVADGDLQRAHSEAARESILALPDEAKPIGWRRVPTGDHTCAMCLVAASQLYSADASNPLHGRCDCGCVLVYNREPRSESDTARLNAAIEELTGRAGGMTDGEIGTVLRLMTPNHGELGRMLVRPDQHFTTTADLPS